MQDYSEPAIRLYWLLHARSLSMASAQSFVHSRADRMAEIAIFCPFTETQDVFLVSPTAKYDAPELCRVDLLTDAASFDRDRDIHQAYAQDICAVFPSVSVEVRPVDMIDMHMTMRRCALSPDRVDALPIVNSPVLGKLRGGRGQVLSMIHRRPLHMTYGAARGNALTEIAFSPKADFHSVMTTVHAQHKIVRSDALCRLFINGQRTIIRVAAADTENKVLAKIEASRNAVACVTRSPIGSQP